MAFLCVQHMGASITNLVCTKVLEGNISKLDCLSTQNQGFLVKMKGFPTPQAYSPSLLYRLWSGSYRSRSMER